MLAGIELVCMLRKGQYRQNGEQGQGCPISLAAFFYQLAE
ncbi:hypothetical protein XBJ2_1840018 [Xenorhabdus bovienii str. Jollieti]|uniref:Uncharacterized protein n=1 Tax=Xenorhabdus bovienii (strain SS-2004) TaxID=406818 RepID=D3V4X5_XENBS|nr:hypothetical protein XBJ1_3586 [Xenorhabdus bovienii SS-2004]CDH28494.1 hypothetical protein XBJ2_1840018 [Xenorhabdus bovienii str. Jollieti]